MGVCGQPEVHDESDWRFSVRRADNLATFMCRLSRNSGASSSWKPQGPLQACSGKALPLPTYN
jgi:hypothetical protein